MTGFFIFDLDGTLVDSRRDLATGVNRMRGCFGLAPLSLETVTSFVGNGTRALIRRATSDAPGVDLDEACELNSRFYARHCTDETRPYPGVLTMLEELKRAGAVLAVLTNKPGDRAREICRRTGMEGLLAAVRGDGDTASLKPDPRGLLDLLDFLRATVPAGGTAGASCCMIGDNYTDLQAARLAGVGSVFCGYGFGNSAGEPYDAGVADTGELQSHLLSLLVQPPGLRGG